MTRKSGSPLVPFVRRAIRGLSAATLVVLGLCATTAGQDAAPEPPPLEKAATPRFDDSVKPASTTSARPTSRSDATASPGSAPRSHATTSSELLQSLLLNDVKITPVPTPTEAPTPGQLLQGTLFNDDGTMPVPLPVVRPRQTSQEQSRANLAFADAHWKQGNVDRARSYYQAAILLDPENIPAGIGHAWTFVPRGYTSQALAELDSIIKQHPESGARAYAARALIRAGRASATDSADVEIAAADVQRALDLDPSEPDAPRSPGRLSQA